MIELRAGAFARAKPVFQGLEDHLAVVALLEGAVPGRIFVDDAARPGAALAWIQQRFYLAGSGRDPKVNEALHQLFVDVIYPESIAAGRALFVLAYDDEYWGPVIEGIVLKDKRRLRVERQYYALNVGQGPHPSVIPAGFALRAVDEALLHETHLENLDALIEEMCSERPSKEAFLRDSFGLCAIHENKIAGWCLSEYNVAHRCEVGIATLDPYQRQGLATAMASAFIEQARSKGVRHIGWHCYTDNIASAATALKAGFEHVMDHPVYVAWFKEAGGRERA
jgi:RimJ/RimL family protein N-acetyltransferase